MDKVVLKVDYILKNTGVPDAEIGKANEMIHDVISEIRDTMNAQFQDNMRNRLMSYQMFLNDIQSVHSEDKCGKCQADSEFYQVIIIEGERETAIGYIKEEDVIKLMEGELK